MSSAPPPREGDLNPTAISESSEPQTATATASAAVSDSVGPDVQTQETEQRLEDVSALVFPEKVAQVPSAIGKSEEAEASAVGEGVGPIVELKMTGATMGETAEVEAETPVDNAPLSQENESSIHSIEKASTSLPVTNVNTNEVDVNVDPPIRVDASPDAPGVIGESTQASLTGSAPERAGSADSSSPEPLLPASTAVAVSPPTHEDAPSSSTADGDLQPPEASKYQDSDVVAASSTPGPVDTTTVDTPVDEATTAATTSTDVTEDSDVTAEQPNTNIAVAQLADEPGDEPHAASSTTPLIEPDMEDEHSLIPRSEKFWFEDGNVIIQAPAKQYRVHRGVLALHSTCFRDMFTLPSEAPGGVSANLMLDGCPVVKVMDEAADWDAVLSIIYHTWESVQMYAVKNPDPSWEGIIPVDTMLSMLRLGHKYDFERVRNDGLRQLKAIFPNTLKAYDAQCNPDISTLPVGKFGLVHTHHSLKIIAVAVELGIETVLPSAYVMVMQHFSYPKLVLEGKDVSSDSPILPQKIRNAIMEGERSLVQDSYSFVFQWLRNEDPPAGDQCQYPENCSDEVLTLLRKFPGDFPDTFYTTETVLRPLSTRARNAMSGLCIPCFRAAVANHDEGRAKVFEYLPFYFELPPWDELKDFYVR